MTTELIIGATGVVLAVLTYFAGVERTKRRYEQDDSETRMNKVVDEYQKLFQPGNDSGLPALIKAGILLVQNDREVREVCRRLELRNNHSPLTPYVDDLRDVDLLRFFQTIRDHKLDTGHPDCVRLAKEKMRDADRDGEPLR